MNRKKLTTRPGVKGFVPLEEKSTKVISFKCTPTEFEAIEYFFNKSNSNNRSEFIRERIFKNIEE